MPKLETDQGVGSDHLLREERERGKKERLQRQTLGDISVRSSAQKRADHSFSYLDALPLALGEPWKEVEPHGTANDT